MDQVFQGDGMQLMLANSTVWSNCNSKSLSSSINYQKEKRKLKRGQCQLVVCQQSSKTNLQFHRINYGNKLMKSEKIVPKPPNRPANEHDYGPSDNPSSTFPLLSSVTPPLPLRPQAQQNYAIDMPRLLYEQDSSVCEIKQMDFEQDDKFQVGLSQSSQEKQEKAFHHQLNYLKTKRVTALGCKLQTSRRVNFKCFSILKPLMILHVLQQLASIYIYNDISANYNHSFLLKLVKQNNRHQYLQSSSIMIASGHLTSFMLADAQSLGESIQTKTIDEPRRIDELLKKQLQIDENFMKPIDIIKQGLNVFKNDVNDNEKLKSSIKHHKHHRRRRHGAQLEEHKYHQYNHHRHDHHHKNHHHDHQSQHQLENEQQHNQYHQKDGITSKNNGGRHRRHDSQVSDSYFKVASGAADRPVVVTKKGSIRGITQKTVTGKFVDAFLGIPFAQPPIGRYRFRHPQPVNPWRGELDASKLSSSCYQVNDTFFGSNFMGTSIWNANTPLDEDCLYLNIWTPFGVANTTMPIPLISNNRKSADYASHGGYNNNQNHHYQQTPPKATSSTVSKRPVLVWIFGGGFYSGTSSLALYEGGALASEEDIIVVSMNYRVSALGFLYFGRPDAPGNAGLFDQLMALQWINDNIDQFGGDPDRVTIFGESAGAVSVAFHLLSPLSRNLFSQAILQSGAATCPWGLMESREIVANGLQLASLVDCPTDQSDLDAVMECLLKASPMALVSQEVGQTRTILNFPFVPVVDGSFLLESPAESLAKANFKQAKILLGSNNDEGNSFLIYLPEYSHCPSTSSQFSTSSTPAATTTSSLSSSSSSVASTSKEQSAIATTSSKLLIPSLPLPDVDLMDATALNADGRLTGELRDQSVGGNDQQQQQIESLDLITYPIRPQPSPFNIQQQQQQQDQNDSKPCKPFEYLSLTRQDFLHVLREELNPYAEHPIGKEAIVFEYSNWNNPQDSVSNYDAIDKIVGDYYFTCHVNELAQQYSQAGNAVYMYYFKQRSSRSPWPKWMGVLHGDEINFVFGEPLNQLFNYTAKEVELSRRMMRYWGNFAKFGNPTKIGENITMAEKWPEYADRRQYFELHSDHIRIGRGPRAKQCAFWSNYLPKLIHSFDKSQCQALEVAQSLPAFPFPMSSQQIGLLGSSRHSFSQQLTGAKDLNFLNSSFSSALLIVFIVILILVTLTSVYLIISKHSFQSWKLNLWPMKTSAGAGASGAATRHATGLDGSDENPGDQQSGSSPG